MLKGSSKAISYHFPRAYWSKQDAKLWLDIHNAVSNHLYTTTNEIRAPQMGESAYRSIGFRRYGKMLRWSNTFSKPFYILVASFGGSRRNPDDKCNVCVKLISIPIELTCYVCSRPFVVCSSCYTKINELKLKVYICYECTR